MVADNIRQIESFKGWVLLACRIPMLISQLEGELYMRPTHDDDNWSVDCSLQMRNNSRLGALANIRALIILLLTATATV